MGGRPRPVPTRARDDDRTSGRLSPRVREEERMAGHRLDPERRALHGHFSRGLSPLLTIDPGDRVCFRTIDAGWGAFENPDPFSAPPKFAPRDPRLDSGHALTGPVAVRGAKAGQTLVVHVEDVRPGRWGWTSAGGYPSPL